MTNHSQRLSSLPAAWELRDALHREETTSVKLLAQSLDLIHSLNEELGAFVAVNGEKALTAAKKYDAARSSSARDLLGGLPLAWKDLIDVAGFPTRMGSRITPETPVDLTHPLVDKVTQAGSFTIGKTAVPEFGLNAYSENDANPPARNPFDPNRTPGGSSGGAAAAVASGMLAVAPGNDGGGSVRIPAAACGLVGLKTSLGLIREDLMNGASEGKTPLTDKRGAPRLAVTGPLGRSAFDAALLLDAMTGARGSNSYYEVARTLDPVHATYAPKHAKDNPQSAKLHGREEPLHIAVSTDSPFDSALGSSLSPESLTALEAGRKLLEKVSCVVVPEKFEYPEDYHATFRTVWTGGLAEAPIPVEAEALLTPLARDFRESSRAQSEETKQAAATRLSEIGRGFREAWGKFDVVLTPALAWEPPEIGFFTREDPERDYVLQCQFTPFTSMVNVSGLPAIVVPVSITSNGLPMAVQLIGRLHSERQLLTLAAAMEAARGPLVFTQN
ncbi:amidase [Neomicrococcus aestuarii]|uniref:Amidase n=1 Tax=Neomicrococcus aestuarii TaxID=556325 RepID=A0A1L2ZP86_9MICC|nr:amidase [Neomicrococcus aestuarii]APF40939.1 hypothetical protein BHE16_07885 [Neomicrococcus aestuarii]MBB5512734.1 amidase [Neomicrococcus aestuarii]